MLIPVFNSMEMTPYFNISHDQCSENVNDYTIPLRHLLRLPAKGQQIKMNFFANFNIFRIPVTMFFNVDASFK